MKKLNLKNLQLNSNDLLRREQLKTVFGGYGGGLPASCTAKCSKGDDVTCTGNPCAAVRNEYCEAMQSDGTSQKKECKK